MAYPEWYLRVTLSITSPQKSKFHNIFWFVPDNNVDSAGAQAAVNASVEDIYGALSADLPNVLTTVDHVGAIEVVYHQLGLTWIATHVESIVGTVTGDQLPDFAATVIQKRTLVSGRSGRGRWYLGPVPESLTTENLLTTAGQDAYAGIAIDWSIPISTTPFGNLTPQLNSVKTSTLSPLLATSVSPVLGTLRGRKFSSAF